jgi:uncharacterized protein YqhQ
MADVIGGQAVIEGVMMLDGDRQAIAVRNPEGKIVVKKDKVRFPANKVANLPFVRGVVRLFYMMLIGIRALDYSVKIAEPEEEEMGKFGSALLLIFSFVFALALFKFLPLLVTKYLVSKIGFLSVNNFVPNVVDGILKVGIFVSYVWIISLFAETRRVFEYHGAEHKTIRCLEAGEKLTVKNVKKYSPYHPRCGTAFVFGVFLISIFVFSLIPFFETTIWENFALRVLLLPVVAGISFEVLRFSSKNEKNIFFRIITAPGLWMQRLTAFEPDDKQIEVGIRALKAARK